jgi:hypothetical protein
MTGATEPYAGIKAADKSAKAAAGTASGTGAGYGTSASGVGSTLVPELTQEAKNPTGFDPTTLNNMNTASAETAGGTNSAISGAATNAAARTHNTGALSGVLDEAARQKQRQMATNTLGIQNANAVLKEKQKQAGLSGLEGVYGTDVGAQLKSEGLVPEDINAWANANKTGWLQDVDQTISAVGGASKGPAAYV